MELANNPEVTTQRGRLWVPETLDVLVPVAARSQSWNAGRRICRGDVAAMCQLLSAAAVGAVNGRHVVFTPASMDIMSRLQISVN